MTLDSAISFLERTLCMPYLNTKIPTLIATFRRQLNFSNYILHSYRLFSIRVDNGVKYIEGIFIMFTMFIFHVHQHCGFSIFTYITLIQHIPSTSRHFLLVQNPGLSSVKTTPEFGFLNLKLEQNPCLHASMTPLPDQDASNTPRRNQWDDGDTVTMHRNSCIYANDHHACTSQACVPDECMSRRAEFILPCTLVSGLINTA